MEFFPLQIFPGGGFDSSILTIVFLGLVIRWILTETLGYSFVGLVVPGYLASVMLISPTSAAVAMVEALVTYLLVMALSEFFSAIRTWSPVFGRDRFFAFLVVSILVRIVGELWLWPAGWDQLTQWFSLSPYLPGPLNSIGLVIVPLAANMYWKLGIRRGSWQILFPTLLVFVLVQWGLLAWTNLRVSEFQVHYEDIAIDLFASPKAYIILLVTASIAARVNIRVGWDFGGILIPALIAIVWFEAGKAIATIGEGILLALVITALLRSGPLRQMNLEGPRKILLVFSVGYFLKFAFAWGLFLTFPQVRSADFFGFGYLLSSLIALKIVQRSSVMLVVVPVTLISLSGFFLGGLITEVLRPSRTFSPLAVEAPVRLHGDEEPLAAALLRRSPLAAPSIPSLPIRPENIELFEEISRAAADSRHGESLFSPEVGLAIDELQLELQVVDDLGSPAYLLAENIDLFPRQRGWGIYLIRPAGKGPLLLSPDGVKSPREIAALLSIARAVDASALFIGAPSTTPTGRELLPRENINSPFHRFFRPWRGVDVIEARFSSEQESTLWLGRTVARAFPLVEIREILGDAELRWEPAPGLNRQREISSETFLTLAMGRQDTRRRALDGIDPSLSPLNSGVLQKEPTLHAILERSLFGSDRRVAAHLSELASPLSPADLESLHQALLLPLMELSHYPPHRQRYRREYALISALASLWNLELSTIHTTEEGGCWHVLREREKPLRGLGFVAIRCEAGAPLIIEIPHPLQEVGAWKLAALSAEELEARLVLAGSSFRSRPDGPLTDSLQSPSFTGAARRAAIISMEREKPFLIQLRGLSQERSLHHDAVLSQDTAFWLSGSKNQDLLVLAEFLQNRGLEVTLDRGEFQFAPLRGIEDRTAAYLRQVAPDGFVRLWLSADFRASLQPRPTPAHFQIWLQRLGREPEYGSILDLIADSADQWPADAPPALPSLDHLESRLREEIPRVRHSALSANPLALFELFELLESEGIQLRIIIDDAREQIWLLAAAGPEGVVGLRLQYTSSEQTLRLTSAAASELSLLTASLLRLEVSR